MKLTVGRIFLFFLTQNLEYSISVGYSNFKASDRLYLKSIAAIFAGYIIYLL